MLPSDSHTRRLHRIATSTSYQLEMDRARGKTVKERRETIVKAAPAAEMAFFCTSCRIDFDALGRKSVYGGEAWPSCRYVAKCPGCGRRAVRLVTDKALDPYYVRSRRLQRDRAAFRPDILQSEEHGFRTYYPNAFKTFIDQRQKRERAIVEKHSDASTRFAKTLALRRELRAADHRNRL